MFDYVATQAQAKELIVEFGRSVKVISANNVEKANTYAVLVAQKKDWLPNQTSVGGTVLSVVQSDKIALVPGDIAMIPELGDTLVFSKETWRVVTVDEVNPAGETCLWKLGVTR